MTSGHSRPVEHASECALPHADGYFSTRRMKAALSESARPETSTLGTWAHATSGAQASQMKATIRMIGRLYCTASMTVKTSRAAEGGGTRRYLRNESAAARIHA